MRSTDNQLQEIMKRADHIKERKSSQKVVFSCAVSACACMVLMVMTFIYIPKLSSSGTVDASVQYGSLLLRASYMGYVVIGILAFLLGVSITFLCIHLKKMRKKASE